jgi:hypothetical protein
MISRTKRKKPRRRRYYRLLNFHIEPELDLRISQAANCAGITISAFVRNAFLKAITATDAIDDCASSEKKSVE